MPKFISWFLLSVVVFFVSCVGVREEMPDKSNYPGYRFLMGVDKDNLEFVVRQDEKVAIVIRGLGHQNMRWLEPRHPQSVVEFIGMDSCCEKSGNSLNPDGKDIFKFLPVGKGKTIITLIARPKSADPYAQETPRDKKILITLDIH